MTRDATLARLVLRQVGNDKRLRELIEPCLLGTGRIYRARRGRYEKSGLHPRADVELIRAEQWQSVWAYLAGQPASVVHVQTDRLPMRRFVVTVTTRRLRSRRYAMRSVHVFTVGFGTWNLWYRRQQGACLEQCRKHLAAVPLGSTTVSGLGRVLRLTLPADRRSRQRFLEHVAQGLDHARRRARAELHNLRRAHRDDYSETLAAHLLHERGVGYNSIACALWPAPFERRRATRQRVSQASGRDRFTAADELERAEQVCQSYRARAVRHVAKAKELIAGGWRHVSPLA